MKSKPIASAYKFCPHCGSSNPQPGDVPFKCSNCGFACFFGPVAAVGGLIVNDDDELLLVRRARDPGKGKWGLPGGFVDSDETAEEALVREIREETNLHGVGNRVLVLAAQPVQLPRCCRACHRFLFHVPSANA